jgi:hypothetical protein
MRESLPHLPFRQPGHFLSVATLRDLCWLIIGLGVIVVLAMKFLVPYLILRDSTLLLDALDLIMCLLFIYLTEGLQQAASLIHHADDDSSRRNPSISALFAATVSDAAEWSIAPFCFMSACSNVP